MAVNLSLPFLHPVAGVQIGTSCAGIKQTQRPDLTVFKLATKTTVAAVFTRNAFCAAPVSVAKEHLASQSPRYFLINTGNANAGTGKQGKADAIACCAVLAEVAACPVNAVLPFSTGVIGQALPVNKIQAAIPQTLQQLHSKGWEEAARAIMTTDTVPKGASAQIKIKGETITLTGIAKGAGMIRPDMATMLAFIATDVKMPSLLLQSCLHQAVNQSFNRITIDGDTSTNDACMLAATGESKVVLDQPDDPELTIFQEALNEVCRQLAQAIVRDGEGATKFIAIVVEEGATEQECLNVAYAIAHSPLVKTAFFASDANWGRILAAVGRAGLPYLDIEAVRIYLNAVCIVENGGRAENYTEERGAATMQEKEITIRVLLKRGEARTQVWTCDFSFDYVRINAEYRT